MASTMTPVYPQSMYTKDPFTNQTSMTNQYGDLDIHAFKNAIVHSPLWQNITDTPPMQQTSTISFDPEQDFINQFSTQDFIVLEPALRMVVKSAKLLQRPIHFNLLDYIIKCYHAKRVPNWEHISKLIGWDLTETKNQTVQTA